MNQGTDSAGTLVVNHLAGTPDANHGIDQPHLHVVTVGEQTDSVYGGRVEGRHALMLMHGLLQDEIALVFVEELFDALALVVGDPVPDAETHDPLAARQQRGLQDSLIKVLAAGNGLLTTDGLPVGVEMMVDVLDKRLGLDHIGEKFLRHVLVSVGILEREVVHPPDHLRAVNAHGDVVGRVVAGARVEELVPYQRHAPPDGPAVESLYFPLLLPRELALDLQLAVFFPYLVTKRKFQYDFLDFGGCSQTFHIGYFFSA